MTCLWSVIISFCNTVFIYFFVLMFLWCLGYSVGTSKLHPQWLNSSANLTSFIWFWAQRCAFPFMFLRKDLPSRTLLPCHQPTAKSAFEFPRASFSLQPPFVSLTVNRQCLPFTHPSYPWFKPPKVSQLYLILHNNIINLHISRYTVINLCNSSTHYMYILDALAWCIQWFKSHIQVKHALLKFIELFGCAVHWRTSNLQKYMSCLISRAQLSQRLAQVWSKLFG